MRSFLDNPEPFSIINSGKLSRFDVSHRRIARSDLASVAGGIASLSATPPSLPGERPGDVLATLIVVAVGTAAGLAASPSARYNCRAAVLLLNLLISRTTSARGGD